MTILQLLAPLATIVFRRVSGELKVFLLPKIVDYLTPKVSIFFKTYVFPTCSFFKTCVFSTYSKVATFVNAKTPATVKLFLTNCKTWTLTKVTAFKSTMIYSLLYNNSTMVYSFLYKHILCNNCHLAVVLIVGTHASLGWPFVIKAIVDFMAIGTCQELEIVIVCKQLLANLGICEGIGAISVPDIPIENHVVDNDASSMTDELSKNTNAEKTSTKPPHKCVLVVLGIVVVCVIGIAVGVLN